MSRNAAFAPLDGPPQRSRRNRCLPIPRWKRGLDIACCMAAMPLFFLLTLFVAILTAITSPGPIFFRQERVGYKGRRFRIYKFRTMHVRADEATHQAHWAGLIRSGASMQKLDARADPRVIPGGWLLRATGLDELPQILNMLRGEMCLVGPRPCIPYEYEQYTPYQRQRLDTIPGLTGLWQVSGKNRTTFDEMIQLDIRYAAKPSLSLDIKIILLTLPALWAQISDIRKARKGCRQQAMSAGQQGLPPRRPSSGGTRARRRYITP